MSEHYRKNTIEAIKVIDDLCKTDEFYLGNVLKYVLRCNYKGDKRGDLEKARYYLDLALSKSVEEQHV